LLGATAFSDERLRIRLKSQREIEASRLGLHFNRLFTAYRVRPIEGLELDTVATSYLHMSEGYSADYMAFGSSDRLTIDEAGERFAVMASSIVSTSVVKA